MSDIRVLPIVEGHGEIESVPILIRRIALTIDPGFVPTVLHPLRIPFTKLRKPHEIERAVQHAANILNKQGAIVVIGDCDWVGGCPATDGPALLCRAKQVCPSVPIAVILAKLEYEAWFLAAAESLRGRRNLPMDLASPEDPESIRGAKEWLTKQMPAGQSYTATEDQAAFTHIFEMNAARRAASFDKCFRDIQNLLSYLHTSERSSIKE